MNVINLTPAAVAAVNGFCEPELLSVRTQLMDELEGFFLEADEVDDHKARDYARALRLLKNDLNELLETTQKNEKP